MEWQPIKTAPREGIIIVGRVTQITGIWQYIHAAYWVNGEGWGLPFDSERDEEGTPFLFEDEQPTHWMPLPKPPVNNNNQG